MEDDLESPSAERGANQLVAIMIFLIPSYLEILKEALDGFVKTDAVLKKLVTLEIAFAVPGRETMPISRSSFYCCPIRPSLASLYPPAPSGLSRRRLEDRLGIAVLP
ncbi:MAG: hypothetical protein ABSG56_39285 [Bryobacteraceae bacterium]